MLMIDYGLGSKAICNVYLKTCEACLPARRLYVEVVEPVMMHPRILEAEASFTGAYKCSPPPHSVCNSLTTLEDLIMGRRVCVIGPLVGEHYIDLDFRCDTVIVVDGVDRVRPDLAGIADVYIGDADSTDPAFLAEWCNTGGLCLIHFHGDNYNRLLQYCPFPPGTIITSQLFCAPPVLGVGSYTDGDRALAVSMALKALEVSVIGFNFERVYWRHKGSRYGSGAKQVKLDLAHILLKHIMKVYGYRLVRLNSLRFQLRRELK